MPEINNNIVPYLILIALFLSIGAIFVRKSDFYGKLVEENRKKFQSIEGLRGYLALSVFICHGSEYFYFIRKDYDKIPPLSFYELIGDYAVSLFFMITGFLFWTKIIVHGGRLDVRRLAISRLARIVPMYMVVFWLVLLLSLYKTHFVIANTRDLVIEVGRWLALGQFHNPDFNGAAITPSVTDNLWTLIWEWRFYALLPLAAFFWKGPRFILMILILGILIAVAPRQKALFNFLGGMISAAILARIGPMEFSKPSLVALASIVPIALTIFVWPQSYGLVQSLSLLPFFIVVASGGTLFGLLTNKPARVLGAMSYSIYMIHLVVLYVVFHLTSVLLNFNSLVLSMFWLWLAMVGVILIVICSITFRWIEIPFIRVGHGLRP
jgi:peptidoglycan/LPS O-acetylase OafA/YrhL